MGTCNKASNAWCDDRRCVMYGCKRRDAVNKDSPSGPFDVSDAEAYESVLAEKDKRISDLEAALKRIVDDDDGGIWAGRIARRALAASETKTKCQQCVYDVRDPGLCERRETPRRVACNYPGCTAPWDYHHTHSTSNRSANSGEVKHD